jgi:hypothetical protein
LVHDVSESFVQAVRKCGQEDLHAVSPDLFRERSVIPITAKEQDCINVTAIDVRKDINAQLDVHALAGLSLGVLLEHACGEVLRQQGRLMLRELEAANLVANRVDSVLIAHDVCVVRDPQYLVVLREEREPVTPDKHVGHMRGAVRGA